MWFLAALFVTTLMGATEGGRILGVFPCPATSHNIMHMALMKELAAKGHHVTILGNFPLKDPPANYRHIPLNLDLKHMMSSQTESSNLFTRNDQNAFQMLVMVWNVGPLFTHAALQNPEVQALIHGDDHFDVLIISSFSAEAMFGFAPKFNAPIISIAPSAGWKYLDDSVGNTRNYAYVPNLLLESSDHMTFCERLMNTVLGIYEELGRMYYYLPKQQALLEEHFGHLQSLPSIQDLEQGVALVMLNTHLSVSYPRPMVPNIIEVGGLHIQPPGKLPQDLQKFLDEAKDGVIYFSMGSILRTDQFPESKRAAFVNVFSKLKQQVFWKWDADTFPGKPDNVKISKWFPQQDILAHPNVRLFMTHGGLLSTLESVHHGVPVVGIPILADQHMNMQKAVGAGYGLKISYKEVTEDTVRSAIREVLDNPKFREAAKRLSVIFRDRPMSALEEAVYWTEYVIRHNGTSHMRSAALDLAWYQYLLLDVIAVVALTAVTSLVLLVFVLKRVAGVLCGQGSQVKPVQSGKKKN